jgi:hypothetical protein
MTMDPERLKASNATKLERRLLAAAGDERPSPEMAMRMRQAIGLSTSGASAGTAALATAKATGLAWISAGIVAAAIVGGAVGIWTSHRRTATSNLAPAAAPAQCVSSSTDPTLPTLPTSPTLSPVAARHERNAGIAVQNRTHLAATTPPSDRADLRDEIALVDEVRTALNDRATKQALALLRRYAVTYPHGTFGPETEALRVEALDESGQHRLAQSLARDFVNRHPDSPLADRIGRSIYERP